MRPKHYIRISIGYNFNFTMTKHFPIHRVALFSVLFAFASMFVFSACDNVKDAVDSVTYKINITNNTDEALTIFESVDDSAFEEATTIDAGASANVTGVIDSKIELEARNADGTVVASRTYNQSDDTDQAWEIN